MALVSILTPTYNNASTLAQTAASVMAQSFTDWEWIVIDDASKDSTRELIRDLAAKDSRIKPIFAEKNAGIALSRQKGLQQATGQFIAFVDADDLWLPQKLEKQVAFMNKTGAALSYTAYRRMSDDGNTAWKFIRVPEKMTYRDMLKNTAVTCATAMINRGVTGPFEMINVEYEDLALWLHFLRQGHVAYGLNEDLVRFRVRKTAHSRNKWECIGRVWHIYRDLEKLSMPYAAWCLAHYGFYAVKKRMPLWGET